MYSHSFDPIAAIEYEEAYFWYQQNSIMAADNFTAAIDDAVNSICISPFLYRKTYKSVREILIKRYPFSLIYEVDEQKKHVIIISIYHHYRDPNKKYRG